MSRDPYDRPPPLALGEELRQAQARHGFPVDEMATGTEGELDRPMPQATAAVGARRTLSNIPLELNSFVGRGEELAEVKTLLATSRLVTLTGIGGVGKTRLGLRAAADVAADFPDGVRLVELGELRDASCLMDVVAAGLDLRDEPTKPLNEVLIDFLCPRKLLLVLDNCEHVVDAAAKLAETLLRACPDLRIWRRAAGPRHRRGSGARLSRWHFPEVDPEPTLGGLPGFDAVALFAERAAARCRDFDSPGTTRRPSPRSAPDWMGCRWRLSWPRARLRAMSPEQLLQRLADRYAGVDPRRGAPTRQQTLGWSVGWSYDLPPAEQRSCGAGSRCSRGSFELEAAEDICGGDVGRRTWTICSPRWWTSRSSSARNQRARCASGFLRPCAITAARRSRQPAAYPELRRRHLGWYQRLARDAADEWFSARQIEWIKRLDQEMPNLREAVKFSLTNSPEAAAGMAAGLSPFWIAHGLVGEGRRWLDQALARTPPDRHMNGSKRSTTPACWPASG
jgi:non-specific serine/threonine protein kinase